MKPAALRIAVLLTLAFSLAGSPATSRDWPSIPAADAARIKARVMCSCLMVQHMSMEQCRDGQHAIWRYLTRVPPSLLTTLGQRLEIEVDAQTTVVRVLEAGKPMARSHFIADGGGCTTDEPGGEITEHVKRDTAVGDPVALPERNPIAPAALSRKFLPSAVDRKAFESALEEGFSLRGPLRDSMRAAFVILDDEVVMERYAPGYGEHNLFYLGSIAKIFNNVLAGLLVRDGKLRVDEPVDRPQWSEAGDPRHAIRFDHLLHMTSGLGWAEDFFTPGAPAYSVYFAGPEGLDVAGFMAARRLEATPGDHFEYSTGSSTLLARALQDRLEGEPRAALLRYLQRELFAPVGISGITLEFDRAGSYLSGHAAYARAEDLARLGLLLLHDGVWQGRRVLPPGWVEYATRPVPTKGEDPSHYGAHLMPQVADVPGCFGHHGVGGQFLAVCPKRNLVLVWFSSSFDFSQTAPAPPDSLVARLIRAFPER